MGSTPMDPDTPEARGAAAAVPLPGESGIGRGSLDRQRILGAAIGLIDEHGLRYLTMRRLGAHLGVEGMALYHYMPCWTASSRR